MKRIKTIKSARLIIPLAAILLVASGWSVYQYAFSAAPLPTPFPFQKSEINAIEASIQAELQNEQPQALALLLYDSRIEGIEISKDGLWSTAWLIPLDPASGEVVPIEPGLVLVRKTAEGWKAFIPSNPLWALVVQEIPEDLIPEEQKKEWFQIAEFRASAVTAPIHGYKLPWAGGDTMVLTQSVGHDRYTPSGSAHFAFDFAKPGYPSGMYNVLAARGGVVKRAVWSNENGNPSNSNYLVLEDTSTSPITYQLYMHFAKDSIPAGLRVIGTHVRQGQMIGIADDTGVSSGNHLHFMVHTYSASYWGTSIDITFDDVSINGGRPRITSDKPYCKSSDVCDTTQSSYVSNNFMSPDYIAPTGGITSPPPGALITTEEFPLVGWAKDENSGIASVQFKAYYENEWHLLGSPFSSGDFNLNWDMCGDKVPDGPVSLALVIRDKAQNQAEGLPGLTHFTKNVDCAPPPTACLPNTNQVAIFAGVDYQGQCVLLNVGSFSSALLGNLGENNAASIMVGANVHTTLFSDDNLLGRGETFFASDSSLAENRIGVDNVSSVIVQSKTSLPAPPVLIWPENEAQFETDATLSLSWENTRGSDEFQLELSSGSTQILLTPWDSRIFWQLSALSPGMYSWRAKGRNQNGESGWSASRTFQINPPQTIGSDVEQTVTAPFDDTMETTPSSWVGTNWSLSANANHTENGSLGWRYDIGSATGYENGKPNEGFLTSPEIDIPASGVFYLRYFYRYETEGPNVHWDQRWVQISENGGAYQNVDQLSSDPPGYWLRGRVISLAAYSGQRIRIRFYFGTLDNQLNQFEGWAIDDFSITAEPPPDCLDQDNNPTSATLIQDGQTLERSICPGGDVDYFQFQGTTGDQIGIRINAQTLGSPLDTMMSLIDSDGSSPLSTNDDIVQYERTDSFISYRLLRSGNFFIKVQAWDHPNVGDQNTVYSISLYKDNQDPDASFITPMEGSVLPSGDVMLDVAARDNHSGISLVRFYWHSNDWAGSNWNYLGEDWDQADGWNFLFDTSGITNRKGTAVYAVVFDWAGNWVGTGAWNLGQPMLYLPLIIRSH